MMDAATLASCQWHAQPEPEVPRGAAGAGRLPPPVTVDLKCSRSKCSNYFSMQFKPHFQRNLSLASLAIRIIELDSAASVMSLVNLKG